jgi:flagellar biosynthesis GTPase FlhF
MNPFFVSLMSGRLLQTSSLIVITLLLQSPVFADIYKWIDDSGEVHYTQTPPPGGIATENIQGAPPPAESAQINDAEQQKLQQQLDAYEERRAEQQKQQSTENQRREVAEIDKENCSAAQANLANLQQGGVKRYLTPAGEVIRLTEEDRQQRISEAQEQVEKYCKP